MAVTVGIRELRNNLRSWLERVKAGEEVVVTERGKPVAQLTPLDSGRRKLQELIDAGLVRPPLSKKRHKIDLSKIPSIDGDGPTLSDIVIEQRRQARY